MLDSENQDIIIISSVDWSTQRQVIHELTEDFANSNHRVLFVENTGVRSIRFQDLKRLLKRLKLWFKSTHGFTNFKKNITIFSPIFLPFPYNWFIVKLNSFFLTNLILTWMKGSKFKPPIVITFLSTPLSQSLIEGLNSKLKIFYCIDNMSKSSKSASKLRKWEDRLFKKADLVMYTSKNLGELAKRVTNNVFFAPSGVNFKKFADALNVTVDKKNNIKSDGKKIIGFIGAVRNIIDKKIIINLSKSFTDCKIVLIGPIFTKIDDLNSLNNLVFLGQKKHDEIPYYIRQFDVGIIPYIKNNFTDSIYPTKINEYLAAGLPVVSTELDEVKNFINQHGPVIKIAKNEKDFIDKVKESLNEKSEQLKSSRINIAKNNDWKIRFSLMSEKIKELLQNKNYDEKEWEKYLINHYRNIRTKFNKAIFFSLVSILILFYTPFTWFVGQQLIVEETPIKSDAIVAFSGSGEAKYQNNSYRNRFLDAKDYYKKGFAKKIYVYGRESVLNESEIMKSLLITSGIPKDNIIILNSGGSNTKGNIEFTNEILNRDNIKSILFITGSYHSKRSKLLWEKNSTKIKVRVVKTNDSPSTKPIWKNNFSTFRVVVYESLAIIYNKIKGWL